MTQGKSVAAREAIHSQNGRNLAAGTLDDRIDEALEDGHLQIAIRRATDNLRDKKLVAMAGLDFEAWRERARAIRAHTVEHLDYYLQQLADRVRQNGGFVHFCRDAAEAVEVVGAIARHYGVKRAVKSKSMVTEEIHLNAALEADGVEVVETDLGEYIVQVAEETPSHIIMPAVHKTRQQIAELFSVQAGESIPSDTPSLNNYARKVLRQKFMAADMGITGCNFAIAETGSVTLFTNEGNARMVTSLPRVHVALMGMERVLPTLADLEVFMNLLPRSASGQRLTSYLSILGGPRAADESDGPEAFHLVVLDNRRSVPLGDPDFREILHCIRCGACLNVCPVYRNIGGHAYGSVYPGPVGAVLTPLLREDEDAQHLPYASSLCGACYEACPVKIPLHDMLVKLRARNVRRGLTPRSERAAFRAYRRMFAKPARFRRSLKVVRRVQGVVARDGYIDAKLPGISGWTQSRSIPAVAKRSFRDMARAGAVPGLIVDEIARGFDWPGGSVDAGDDAGQSGGTGRDGGTGRGGEQR